MVRTRFAPSPTGYLHIGGVRTALFNWLFARRHGGRFILRIDDTDQQRNFDEALAPILHGFRWLGIDWDEGPEAGGDSGPYFQSQRLQRYQQAARTLVDKGLAYHDYARPEELEAERAAAQARKERFIYSRRWAAETPNQRRAFEAEGRSPVIRLKMPRVDACAFHDQIRGGLEFEWAAEQDHVIQRADGSCLYHLASVVDDIAMQITHVIRAEEHLSNTPRQVFIFRGLGHEPPRFAHLPFVAEAGSRTKLSKRKIDRYFRNPDFAALHERGLRIAARMGLQAEAEAFNPVVVGFYEQIGFLPSALVNYLLLLGWSLDDRTEFFSREQMVEHFSLERVNKAPASFDLKKLLAFQAHYMQDATVEQRLQLALPFLQQAKLVGSPPSPAEQRTARQVVEAAGERIVVAGDVLDYPEFFIADADLSYDDKAFDKRIRKPPDAIPLLERYRDVLAAAPAFEPAALEQDLKAFADAQQIKLGQIIHAVRVAVTGKAVGFGLFESLAILGMERCLSRIDRALARARSAA